MKIAIDPLIDDAIRRTRVSEPTSCGRLIRMVGLTLEARGIRAPVGALCSVEGAGGARVEAEVVGFNDTATLLMPFDEPAGIGPGATVRV